MMHIHIVSIAGNMTAPLAIELSRTNKVTGSDQKNVFPPISTLLDKANIKINQTPINHNIDLAIIGSSYKKFKNTQEEYHQIKTQQIPSISATKYIAKNVIKKESILIAGTYGKTTISSLISWIFITAKKNPSYMFGGIPKNKIPSLKISNSNYSILEADESINGLDTKAKFLYYPKKYVLITSAEWEHKDSYSSESQNISSFKRLVKDIPTEGMLIIKSDGYKTKYLAKFTPAKTITYNTNQSDYYIKKQIVRGNISTLYIQTPKEVLEVVTGLVGQFNFENILAAVAMSSELRIEPKFIKKAVCSYKGIVRRLELKSFQNNIYFYDDSAQSSTRIKSSLEAIRTNFPDSRILVFFEPHASFLQNKSSIDKFHEAFSLADKIVLGKIKFDPKVSKTNRTTATSYKKELGSKLTYLPLTEDVVNYFKKNIKSGDILIRMSSGGNNGAYILKSIINFFKEK